jgi:hypothetical protein
MFRKPQGETMSTHPCDTAHKATVAMHPAQSWRDGWDDAVQGLPFGTTQDGYRTIHGKLRASTSEMYYADGYSCGSVRRQSIKWIRND